MPLFQQFDKMDGEQHTQVWMLLWMISCTVAFLCRLRWSHTFNQARIAALQRLVEQEQALFETFGFYIDFRLEHRSDTPGMFVLVRFRPISGVLTTPFRAIA